MSFLFDKRGQKTIKWIWITFAIIIALSMVFAYSSGVGGV